MNLELKWSNTHATKRRAGGPQLRVSLLVAVTAILVVVPTYVLVRLKHFPEAFVQAAAAALLIQILDVARLLITMAMRSGNQRIPQGRPLQSDCCSGVTERTTMPKGSGGSKGSSSGGGKGSGSSGGSKGSGSSRGRRQGQTREGGKPSGVRTPPPNTGKGR